MGPGVKLATDWSVAFSHARLERAGQPDVSGSSDHFYANLPLLPRRVEARVSPVSWMDLGLELGWLEAGANLRFGVPSKVGKLFAGNVALGATSSASSPFKDTKKAYSVWARTEFYPLLSDARSGAKVTSHRGVLSLGVDVGSFYHQLQLAVPNDTGESYGPSWLALVRDEARLEGAIGYTAVSERASVLVALEPYAAIDLNTDPARCSRCSSYQQSWGLVLVLNLAVFVSFERGTKQPWYAP
jgi:hypothetical protein